ncbi:MAG: tetratricopeptide repeat protein, partial [Thermoleophilaceae bacterium]
MAGVVFVVALAVFTLVNRPPASLPGTAGSAPAPAPSSSVSTEARIGGLEAALERGDGEPETYAALGSALMQRLRETGDAGLYRRADMAFAEALERDPSNLDATVGLGTLALARHDFRAGLRHGLRAQRINPGSFAPFAVLVDARIELGRYAAAERTLQQMIDFKPALASYARVSYYRELHGDLEGALDAMRLAVSSAPGPGENRSYVQTLLGNLEFERGRIAAAEDAYRMALAGFAAYAPAEAGLARVDAARGRLGSAIARLRGVVQRLPLPG